MKIKKRFYFFLFLLSFELNAGAQISASSSPSRQSLQSPQPHQEITKGPQLCYSTQEFIKSFEFLRTNGTSGMKLEVARELADQVARGCDGAADRFKETFLLLTKMGVSFLKSLQIGLEFARLTNEMQKNFFSILKQSYLSEFLDYDFNLSLQIAFEFSRDLKSNHLRAREDFSSLVRFCLDKKNQSIPLNLCGLISLELVRLSPYYPDGIYAPFIKLYEKLRSTGNYGLSIRDSLVVIFRILRYGPRAPQNFEEAYAYAVNDKGLHFKPQDALVFALRMARRSSTSKELPLVIPPEKNGTDDVIERSTDQGPKPGSRWGRS